MKKTPTENPPAPLLLTEANPSRQEHVDLSSIAQPPWVNPREPVKPERVRGLAATMERFGMLQPVVVTPAAEAGKYYLLAGYRRVAAASSLGWRTVPAHVLVRMNASEITVEHLARSVALVENGQRENLDPLRDCEVVEQLLAEDGATLETVAAELGRSASWVARRARLVELAPEVRASVKAGRQFAGWPAAWLEWLALLPAAEQAAVAGLQLDSDSRVQSLEELRALVRKRLGELGAAPWDLRDASLLPQAGACSACSKHSAAQPNLFEEPGTLALERAQCMDRVCFELKQEAFRALAVERAKKKHGDGLLLVRGPHEWKRGGEAPEEWTAGQLSGRVDDELRERGGETSTPAADAPKVLGEYDYKPAKKGERGALPALVVEGKGEGTVKWVKPAREEQELTKDGAKAKPKGMPEKVEQLKARRRKSVVDALDLLLEEWEDKPSPELAAIAKDPEALLALVATWGCQAPENCGALDSHKVERTHLHLEKKTRGRRVLLGLLSSWSRCLEGGFTKEGAQQAYDEAVAVLQCTGQGKLFDELAAKALERHPEPKAWAQKTLERERREAVKKAKPAAKKARKS